MFRSFHVGRRSVLCLIAVIAIGLLLAGRKGRPEFAAKAQSPELRPNGYPQLISIEPLPQADGEICEWIPANAHSPFRQQRSGTTAGSAGPTASRTAVDATRAPLRVIRDPNPAFSAVAVEPEHNMLVVTDENLFRVLEYDRRDSTPRQAKLTEPKRVVGGALTKAEMMCGVYIDPKTLDTYIVNNDTQNWLAVFSKEARGNVAPDRFLAVPLGTFGIAVDEGRQELFLTIQHQNAVMVYRKMASGEEPPLRVLEGDDTRLADPHGIALDVKDNLVFVSNYGHAYFRGKGVSERAYTGDFARGSGRFEPPSITVHALDAKGNTLPLRIIRGPKTRLNWPSQMAVDEERGELYVANDTDHSIIVFRTSDEGDVPPTRMIRGSRTGLRNPTGLSLDLKHREVWVADMGTHTASVFSTEANGDVSPLRTIRGGPANEFSLMIGNPGGVGYDTKREQILVPN